ncbi:MAG: hypothetical protein RL755_18 [Pseudomonadota bacterium]|jgi:hypothetical protein
MAIKSTNFGRTELSGQDAVRFIQHMNEDKPNEKLKLSIKRGKKILKLINDISGDFMKLSDLELTHDQVFNDLENAVFTPSEAIEYLEITDLSLENLRRVKNLLSKQKNEHYWLP